MRIERVADLERIDFARASGLVTVIAQHARTGVVLMLAHANRDALVRTLQTGEMWYWSRTRSELWHKGATSGNTQRLVTLHADCDADAVLALVLPAGPACHTGAATCFDAAPTLPALAGIIAERAGAALDGSYTARLLADPNLRLKKLGEEAVELALACTAGDRASTAEEAADLLYHALVACAGAGVDLESVLTVLDERRSASRPAEENAIDAE